jgi:hypothetical protein
VKVSSENLRPSHVVDGPLLILDTSHAVEGFVVLKHGPEINVERGSSKRRLQPGDVIISRLRPYLRQVAYVDEALFAMTEGGNDVVGSSEFYVLRGSGDFPVGALVPYLLSEPIQAALAAAQEGGHHPRFHINDLLALPVPAPIVESAEDTAAQVRNWAADIRRGLSGVSALARRATDWMGGAT